MGRLIKEMVVQDCPIRNVLARVCDKWSLLVIYTLKYHQDGPLRFNALRKLIPDISQKMLTSTLKSLEADGYVTRKAYAEVPPRVEYTLTPIARSFLREISYVIEWGQLHFEEIMASRQNT